MKNHLTLLGALLLASACSSSSTSDGGGTTTSYNLTGGSTGGTTGSGTPAARMRVAGLSPDAPAFDYCVSVAGTGSFIGPILAARGTYGGLAYPAVGDYTSLTPNTYVLRFVAPSSANCGTALPNMPDITTLPALAGSTSYTVALMGPVASLTALTLTDDLSVVGTIGMRYLAASAGFAPLDLSANGTLLFGKATFATLPAAGGSIDANGYTALASGGPLNLSFAVHGSGSAVLVVQGVTFTADSVNSVFSIPPPPGYSGTLTALVCYDSLQPTQGLTRCIAQPVP